MGNPATGKRGLGNSRDKGRNRVPGWKEEIYVHFKPRKTPRPLYNGKMKKIIQDRYPRLKILTYMFHCLLV